MPICTFCSKEFRLRNATTRHEYRCIKNPDRRPPKVGGNQYTKAAKLGLPKPIISDESRTKMRNSQLGKNSWWSWKENVDEIKLQHSKSMQLAVLENPESYTSSNRGRVKQIEKYGIKFHGSWELLFFEYCLANNIQCIRGSKNFEYTFENKNHLYFPDFYLPALDIWVEVKGYKTEKDDAKWKQFPCKLIVLCKDEISAIKSNTFKLF